MNLIHIIHHRKMLRRADRVISKAKREKTVRDHLNRPHIQSEHMTSFVPPRQRQVPGARPPVGYLVFIVALTACVVALNVYYQQPAYACMQLAGK